MSSTEPGRPRLGIVAYNPIQYHSPLHQLLQKRGTIALDVLFLSDVGLRATVDPGFGQSVAWDIDLVSGFAHSFLRIGTSPAGLLKRIWGMLCWLPSHDVVVVNGYNSPWMLLAMTACRILGIPYLLRASSHPAGQSTGIRRHLRSIGTRIVIANSSGGLSMGTLNHEFYRMNRARSVTLAPNSVDNDRFSQPPSLTRSEVLRKWNIRDVGPVILFCGKLIPRKHPLDVAAAISQIPLDPITLFVGDGPLGLQIRGSLRPGSGAVTGFINQSDLPSYYHAADILVLPSESETWGLVVNEAMACGVLPVVSDRVGCAPDLVAGVGEVFACGDVGGLANALSRAITRLDDPDIRNLIRQRVESCSLARTAEGFEQAALKASHQRRRATTRAA